MAVAAHLRRLDIPIVFAVCDHPQALVFPNPFLLTGLYDLVQEP